MEDSLEADLQYNITLHNNTDEYSTLYVVQVQNGYLLVAGLQRGELCEELLGLGEHTWDDLFVEEQGLEVGAYPSEAQAVEFAVWMRMRRERACLAQRAEAGARLGMAS